MATRISSEEKSIKQQLLKDYGPRTDEQKRIAGVVRQALEENKVVKEAFLSGKTLDDNKALENTPFNCPDTLSRKKRTQISKHLVLNNNYILASPVSPEKPLDFLCRARMSAHINSAIRMLEENKENQNSYISSDVFIVDIQNEGNPDEPSLILVREEIESLLTEEETINQLRTMGVKEKKKAGRKLAILICQTGLTRANFKETIRLDGYGKWVIKRPDPRGMVVFSQRRAPQFSECVNEGLTHLIDSLKVHNNDPEWKQKLPKTKEDEIFGLNDFILGIKEIQTTYNKNLLNPSHAYEDFQLSQEDSTGGLSYLEETKEQKGTRIVKEGVKQPTIEGEESLKSFERKKRKRKSVKNLDSSLQSQSERLDHKSPENATTNRLRESDQTRETIKETRKSSTTHTEFAADPKRGAPYLKNIREKSQQQENASTKKPKEKKENIFIRFLRACCFCFRKRHKGIK